MFDGCLRFGLITSGFSFRLQLVILKYSSLDGKIPTLKELTAEYDGLKERKENDQAALDKLKPKLTDLKHIRYNYEILERDSAPNSHQHVIPKDHHYDEHGADHDDESR